MEVIGLTIKEASEKLAGKEVSSEDLVSACLDRIEHKNEELNALLGTVDSAKEQAKAIDERRASGEELGPMAGIPVVVKDNITVQGETVTAGSRILENYKATYNATVVNRLKEAGAIIVGRANMDEFAMGSSGESSHFGATKNPWDVERVPGGSSAGSITSVASSMVPGALGSDTGGSIRQPAALCGVTGLKPTYGRVSRYGLMALASSLDQIGPITHTAYDAAMLLSVIEGRDPYDGTSSDEFETVVPNLLSGDIKGLRVGLPKEYFTDGLDPNVKAAVETAIKQLEDGGAEVKEISLPHAEYALAAYYIIMPAEASSNLARFDGVRYGYSASGRGLDETYTKSRGGGFGGEVKRRIMLGTYTLSAGYYDAYYRQALKARTLIRQDFDNAFKEVDVIASPTSPTTAWKIGEKVNDPVTMYLSDIYTVSANLAALPAISVPCGMSEGLPIGLQLTAKPFAEDVLLNTAHHYQSNTDWHTKTP